jgi:hypothetical protein
VKPKPPVPLWRWAVWSAILAAALMLFYVLLTPVWMGLRAAAWAAEFRARRRRSRDAPVLDGAGGGGAAAR